MLAALTPRHLLFVAVGIDGRGGKAEGSVFVVSLMEEQLRIVNRKQVGA